MSDPLQLTTDQIYFRDPDIDPPPRNVNMILLNEGGVLIVGPWSKGCMGWCPKPKIPESVKKKLGG